MESAAIGGVIGEVMIKKVYGRTGYPSNTNGVSLDPEKKSEP
jgi:hypothetical protein